MLQFILMGAQAAGAISSYMGYRTAKGAAELEQQQLRLRLQQETIASNQQGLSNLSQLEETLASQRAMMAARGVMPGIGSANVMARKAVREYGRDEEARKLSLGFLKTQRLSQIGTSKIGVHAKKAKMMSDVMGSAMGGANTYQGMPKVGLLTGGPQWLRNTLNTGRDKQ